MSKEPSVLYLKIMAKADELTDFQKFYFYLASYINEKGLINDFEEWMDKQNWVEK